MKSGRTLRQRTQQCRHRDPSLPSLGPAGPLALVLNGGPDHLLSFPLQDHTGLMGKVKDKSSHKDQGTRELFVPQGDPPQPAHHVRTMPSKWERFLQPPGNSQCVDMEPPVPLNRDPRPAEVALTEQGTLRAQTPRERYVSRPHDAPKLLWLTHTLTSGSQSPCVKTTKQPWDTNPLAKGGSLATGAQEPPLVQLCDLFKTGEDFEDHL